MGWRSVLDKIPASDVRTSESRDDSDDLDQIHVRGFLWTLFVFKMATVAAIFWAARGSSEASILIFVTTWPWLIIPGIVLFGWLAFRFRMRRVRARREALQRSEWMVVEHERMDMARRGTDREA